MREHPARYVTYQNRRTSLRNKNMKSDSVTSGHHSIICC